MSSFNTEKSREFVESARQGNLPVVKILSRDPEVDLNLKGYTAYSPFHQACLHGHVGMVEYLLGFHDNRKIHYNSLDGSGWNPFMSACWNGHDEIVEILLVDERIDVNNVNTWNQTPLWIASEAGHVVIVKMILASGRSQIEVRRRDKRERKTAVEAARNPWRNWFESNEDFEGRKKRGLKIASLLEEFEGNPSKVREELRDELWGPLASEVFAWMVFLSDGYLKFPE